MKTNTFYKPKNEYNELLASIPYVNSEDKILEEKINLEAVERTEADNAIRTDVNAALSQLTSDYIAADNKLHTKIDTLNTIKVITISDADSIDEYFAKRWDSFKPENIEEEIEKLKIELSQSIYLIKGKDDETTWEEYVCRSFSEVTTNRESLDMVRLGAVDSILARLNSYGSVKLVHNVYEDFAKWEGDADEYWAQYHVTKFDNEGKEIRVPVKGLALAPCSLKAFADTDNEIKIRLTDEEEARKAGDTSIRTDINDALTQITSDYIKADTDLDTRIQYLEKEIGGSQSNIENEIEIHDSRIDLIEAAIGMNHQHCDNCGCEHDSCSSHDSCSCSDATNKCTIYCRLNDAEDDLQEHMNILEEHRECIEALEETSEKHTANISNLQIEDANIKTLIGKEVTRLDDLINGNVNRLDGRIDEAQEKITENKDYIEDVEKHLEEEETRSKSVDANLREDIDNEVEIRTELSDYVHHVLDTTVNNHSTAINNNANAIDAHGIRITAAESKIGDLQSNLSTTDKTVSEHYSQFSAKISEFAAAIGTNTNAIANINNDIANRINNKLNSLDIADAEIISSLSDLETKVDRADNDLDNRLTDVERKVIESKNDIDKNKADLTVLTSRIIVAEEKLGRHEEAIAANDTLTHQNSNDIGELRTELGDAKNIITSNTARIADLETNSATKEFLQSAKTEAITTATENAKQYTNVEVGKLSLKLSTDITVAKQEAIEAAEADATAKKQEAVAEANQNIELAKSQLLAEIDSKVSNDVFESYSQSVESILETKASSNDLVITDNKLTTVEKDLEDISHELHHLTSQTQFAVRTSIPGVGAKVIQFYNLIGPDSNEWDLVRITSVVANDEIIYPEIEYSGELTGEKDDERKVEITFEHGGVESLPVILIVSAFKASEYRIIEID